MRNVQSQVLWVVVALLLGVIAGLVVGHLSYSNKNIRKAVLAGLGAFGATFVASVMVEGQLGLA